ncbi:MAG TPA: hypothetical protein VJB16_00520, partial [archaeon]|nr:hypothetical protein [archaeon]
MKLLYAAALLVIVALTATAAAAPLEKPQQPEKPDAPAVADSDAWDTGPRLRLTEGAALAALPPSDPTPGAFSIQAAADAEFVLEQTASDPPLFPGQEETTYQAYQQRYQGIPIVNSGVLVVRLGTGATIVKAPQLPDITVSTTPTISGAEAAAIATAGLPVEPEQTSLVILPRDGREASLAWQVDLPLLPAAPEKWTVFVDAHTGAVLSRFNHVVFDTISGNITGRFFPRNPNQTAVEARFAYGNVTANLTNGTTFIRNASDASGRYRIDGTSGTVNLSAGLRGPFVDVRNANQSVAQFSASLSGNATQDVNWSANDASYKQEESNLFHHVNAVHGFFTAGAPFNISAMN